MGGWPNLSTSTGDLISLYISKNEVVVVIGMSVDAAPTVKHLPPLLIPACSTIYLQNGF